MNKSLELLKTDSVFDDISKQDVDAIISIWLSDTSQAPLIFPNKRKEWLALLKKEDLLPELSVKKNALRFIDLFAGIGGFHLALSKSNTKCVFASEWDSFAIKTYSANHNIVPFGDIKNFTEGQKFSIKDIPEHELLCAGFPCQPFSSIGKREGFKHETQGNLFFDIYNILKEKKPKYFILENVRGLLTHENGETFSTILEYLSKNNKDSRKSKNSLNYHVFHKVIDSAFFGVPQHRRRVFLVGFNADVFEERPSFKFPVGNKTIEQIGSYLEKGVTEKGHSLSQKMQDYMFKKDDGNPQIINKNSKIAVRSLLATYYKGQRKTGTFVKDGPTGLRKLTVGECKSIMGFPQTFKVPVSKTQMYRQFGNSVVVPVVEAIFKQILLVGS